MKKLSIIIFCVATMFIVCSCNPTKFAVNEIGCGQSIHFVTNKLAKRHPYIIVHKDSLAWQLDDYKVDEKNNSISGILKPLPAERLSFKTINRGKSIQNITCNPRPYDELHLSLSYFRNDSLGRAVLDKNSIWKIEKFSRTSLAIQILIGFLYFLLLAVLAIIYVLLIIKPPIK